MERVVCIFEIVSAYCYEKNLQADRPDPALSEIVFLPILNMAPSEASTVLTTLKFIQSQAQKYKQVAKLTFDLPLYMKAKALQSSDESLKDIFICLGKLHQRWAYMKGITHIMTGSGLEAIVKILCGEKSGR